MKASRKKMKNKGKEEKEEKKPAKMKEVENK